MCAKALPRKYLYADCQRECGTDDATRTEKLWGFRLGLQLSMPSGRDLIRMIGSLRESEDWGADF